jgi:hypothetical protein
MLISGDVKERNLFIGQHDSQAGDHRAEVAEYGGGAMRCGGDGASDGLV